MVTPSRQISHSFNRMLLITINAKMSQKNKINHRKKRNEHIPTATPILNTVPLMLYRLEILNNPEKINNTRVFTSIGAEK